MAELTKIRFCGSGGCLTLVTDARLCPVHAAEHAAREKFRRDPWYSRVAWKVVRGYKLRHFPICEDCKIAPATEVHHVDKSWRKTRDWTLFIGGVNGSNLLALCKECHSRRTRRGE